MLQHLPCKESAPPHKTASCQRMLYKIHLESSSPLQLRSLHSHGNNPCESPQYRKDFPNRLKTKRERMELNTYFSEDILI